MIFKVGDVYRNKESNIPCFIRDVKGMDYVITWCIKLNLSPSQWGRPVQPWEEVIEGPDGYIEYRVIKRHKELLTEIDNLNIVEYKNNNKIIMNWIPQHSFLAL